MASPGLAEVRERLLRDLVVWQLWVEGSLPAVPDGYRVKSDRHSYLAPYATGALSAPPPRTDLHR